MSTRLSDQIKEAFTVAGQRRLSRRDRRRRALAGHRKSDGRDAYLEDLIRRYRLDPATWSVVLLEAVSPAVVARLSRFTAALPAIEAEDIAQEFVLQLLVAAATMPLQSRSKWIERRLVLRAGTAVSRWLKREAGYQSRLEPEKDVDAEVGDGCD